LPVSGSAFSRFLPATSSSLPPSVKGSVAAPSIAPECPPEATTAPTQLRELRQGFRSS
jgi:hypothetical protein